MIRTKTQNAASLPKGHERIKRSLCEMEENIPMAEQEKRKNTDSIDSWTREHLGQYARDYGPALSRYFARRGADPTLVEDLTQTVFTRLAARAVTEEVSNPEAYLMQTASSVWMDHLRRKQRRGEHKHLEFEDSHHSPEGISPERVLMGKEAVRQLVEALNELPERTRHVYLLCRLEGLRRKEVAKRFGITVSAVDKHLMSASKHIGLALGDE